MNVGRPVLCVPEIAYSVKPWHATARCGSTMIIQFWCQNSLAPEDAKLFWHHSWTFMVDLSPELQHDFLYFLNKIISFSGCNEFNIGVNQQSRIQKGRPRSEVDVSWAKGPQDISHGGLVCRPVAANYCPRAYCWLGAFRRKSTLVQLDNIIPFSPNTLRQEIDWPW